MNIKRASHIFTHILPAIPLNRIIAVDIYFSRAYPHDVSPSSRTMTCQNHVLLENAFELRSTRPEERLTMREMEFRDKTAIQRMPSRNYSNVDSETRRNVCKLRLVPFIGDVNKNFRSFAVTFSVNKALLTESPLFLPIVFVSRINRCCRSAKTRERVSKEKIHYALPACRHQPGKIAAVAESK